MDDRGSNPVAGGNAGDGGRRGGTDGGAATNTAASDDLGIVDDGNIENVWNHGRRVGAGFKCRYCYWMKKGGGATRLREHLGGISGNVLPCNVVPPNVRDAMRIAIRKGKQKRRDAKERKLIIEDELTEGVNQRVDDDELQRALAASMRDLHFRVFQTEFNILLMDSYFKFAAVNLPLRFTQEDHFTHATQDADHGSRPSRLCKKKDLSSLH